MQQLALLVIDQGLGPWCIGGEWLRLKIPRSSSLGGEPIVEPLGYIPICVCTPQAIASCHLILHFSVGSCSICLGQWNHLIFQVDGDW